MGLQSHSAEISLPRVESGGGGAYISHMDSSLQSGFSVEPPGSTHCTEDTGVAMCDKASVWSVPRLSVSRSQLASLTGVRLEVKGRDEVRRPWLESDLTYLWL